MVARGRLFVGVAEPDNVQRNYVLAYAEDGSDTVNRTFYGINAAPTRAKSEVGCHKKNILGGA